jgi:hypothetical protein
MRARDLMIVDLAVAKNAPATIKGALDLRHLCDEFPHHDVQHRGVHLNFINQICEFLSYGNQKLHENLEMS